MLQLHALASQPVERRRVELFVAMTTQITPAHVIGEDEEDVGLLRGRGFCVCKERGEGDDESQPKEDSLPNGFQKGAGEGESAVHEVGKVQAFESRWLPVSKRRRGDHHPRLHDAALHHG